MSDFESLFGNRSTMMVNNPFDQYQAWVGTKVKRDFQTTKERVACAALGLAGEAGELADLVKKTAFHDKPADLEMIKRELGDALFYLADLASLACIPLSVVVAANMEKLNARYPNGFDPIRAHAPGGQPIEDLPKVSPDCT